MHRPILRKVFVPITFAFVLTACDGGDGWWVNPPAPSGTAEGLWSGTTGTNRTIAGLVLDDGSYWFIYSSVGNSAVIAGAIQGTGTSSDGTYTSSNGVDFNLEGAGLSVFSLSGTYTQKSQLAGTLTYASATTVSLTATYSPDYDLVPSLTSVAGTYTGSAATAGGVEAATVTVSSTGAIEGASVGGCTYTGTGSVRAKGNVYDISITFGGGVCSNGTDTVTGVAYYTSTDKQLTGAALNSGRTNGFLFVGVKP